MSNRWLSIRVEFLGNFIVFFAAVFAFYLRYNFSFGNENLIDVTNDPNPCSTPQGHTKPWGNRSLDLLCNADDRWVWLDNQVDIYYPARTLRALGLLLADGAPTVVGRGKTF